MALKATLLLKFAKQSMINNVIRRGDHSTRSPSAAYKIENCPVRLKSAPTLMADSSSSLLSVMSVPNGVTPVVDACNKVVRSSFILRARIATHENIFKESTGTGKLISFSSVRCRVRSDQDNNTAKLSWQSNGINIHNFAKNFTFRLCARLMVFALDRPNSLNACSPPLIG